jgi:hypothetical protein
MNMQGNQMIRTSRSGTQKILNQPITTHPFSNSLSG